MMEHNVNVNAAECIKETIGWDGNTYHNICADTTTFVAHGPVDIALGLFVGGILILISLMVISMLVSTIRTGY
jgi:hypothetical protein